jgi:cell division protein FtsQ
MVKLRARISWPPNMLFRPKKNRRRMDVAKKTEELKTAATRLVPTLLKVVTVILATITLVWGSAEGWRWAKTTQRLALRQVLVVGAERATEAGLVRFGGVTMGANLMTLEVAAIEAAMSAHPWVRKVSVFRRLPSTLVIEVEEHRPMATLALGELYLVNEFGEPFKRLSADDDFDLPLVTGFDRDSFANSRAQALLDVQRATQVLGTYAASAAVKDEPLSEVRVDRDVIVAVTNDGQEIRFADVDLEAQMERLARVRRELAQREISASVIRLDNRARPLWVTVQMTNEVPEKGTRSSR